MLREIDLFLGTHNKYLLDVTASKVREIAKGIVKGKIISSLALNIDFCEWWM